MSSQPECLLPDKQSSRTLANPYLAFVFAFYLELHADVALGQERPALIRPFNDAYAFAEKITVRINVLHILDITQAVKVEMIQRDTALVFLYQDETRAVDVSVVPDAQALCYALGECGLSAA
jgi:hypothetical protein